MTFHQQIWEKRFHYRRALWSDSLRAMLLAWASLYCQKLSLELKSCKSFHFYFSYSFVNKRLKEREVKCCKENSKSNRQQSWFHCPHFTMTQSMRFQFLLLLCMISMWRPKESFWKTKYFGMKTTQYIPRSAMWSKKNKKRRIQKNIHLRKYHSRKHHWKNSKLRLKSFWRKVQKKVPRVCLHWKWWKLAQP